MGKHTTQNTYSSFPEINKLCKNCISLEIYRKEYPYGARTPERQIFRQFQTFVDYIQEVKINCLFQIQTSQVFKNVIKLLFLVKMIKKRCFVFAMDTCCCRHRLVHGSLT